MTLLQRNCSDGQRGRGFGALGAVEGVAIVAGTLTAGLLAGALGIVPVSVAPAAGYVVAGTFVLVALHERTGLRRPSWADA
jgi:hypothetical protein